MGKKGKRGQKKNVNLEFDTLLVLQLDRNVLQLYRSVLQLYRNVRLTLMMCVGANSMCLKEAGPATELMTLRRPLLPAPAPVPGEKATRPQGHRVRRSLSVPPD